MIRTLWLCCGTIVLICATAGCIGSKGAKVSGRLVRADGTPLVSAKVIARSSSTGNWAVGLTNDEGEFSLKTPDNTDKIPPGDYYVIIREDLGNENRRLPRTIDKKYSLQSRSGIRLNLEAGDKEELNLTLDPI